MAQARKKTSRTAKPVDAVAHNRSAWDREVARGENEWTLPVGSAVIARARKGDWSVVLIGHKPVPRQWFPRSLKGLDVLCLASGGGQQGPVLAAAGANVTAFDNSPNQLAQDRIVADREGLSIKTVLGDMRDLGALKARSFDLIFHPVSNVYCPDLAPVWRECFRVLRKGGALLAGFMNPDLFIFGREAEDSDKTLVVRHALPYSDLTHLSKTELKELVGDQPLEYSHLMSEQIGGQLEAGFVITAFDEARYHAESLAAQYIPGYFATRAVKP